MPLNQAQIQESFSYVDEDVKTLIPNILKLNLYQDSSERHVINSLNKQLSIPKHRLEALEFLNLLIPSCSSTLIAENALNWLNYCLVLKQGDNLKEIKLITIGNIIEHAYQNQEFTKRFIVEYIAKILDCCLSGHENIQETEAALKTLTICLKRYASWFNIHKAKIESFILTFLSNSSDNLVENAGVAFHHFQQIGGAGLDGINHKKNFSLSFHKLCVTVHHLFDEFFEDEVELEQFDYEDQDHIAFNDGSHESVKKMHLTARRIKNCISFLKTMLLKGYPVPKEIKPTSVLDIICRGTNVHKCLTSDAEKNLQEYQYSLLLTEMQTDLLQLLRILLMWLKTNSLPFAYTISKVLIDLLHASHNCRCFESEKKFQKLLYLSLIEWIRCIKCSLHVRFQTQLLDCIIKSITPLKNEITLSVHNEILNKSSKLKKKSIQNKIIASGQQHDNSLLSSSTEKDAQIRICSLALDTLKELLNYTRLKVDGKKLKDLYAVVIENLLKINSYKTCHPYTDVDCQEKLYEVLAAFYEQETLPILPPISISIDIFTKGITSRHRNVRIVSERSLNTLEKLCQPVCPSLYIPEMFNLKNFTENVEKTMVEYTSEDMFENDVEMDMESRDILEKSPPVNGEAGEKDTSEVTVENEEETIEIDDSLLQSTVESDQNDTIAGISQATSPSVKIIDVQVVNDPEVAKDGEEGVRGTETALSETCTKEQTSEVSKSTNESNAIEIGAAIEEPFPKDINNSEIVTRTDREEPSTSVIRKFSPSPEENLERPAKISKLDLPDESKKTEDAALEEEIVSDGDFVDEVIDY